MGSPLVRINVGCGAGPTEGYENLDNSLTVRIATAPWARGLLEKLPVFGAQQRSFMERARNSSIRWAEASRLPYPDGSASVVYSSHMVEHLTREEAEAFIKDAYRVLAPGGWVRLVIPDLLRRARSYTAKETDADTFVESLLMASPRPKTLRERLSMALAGPRHHLWMYDEASLGRLLRERGFVNVSGVQPGETHLPDPGHLDLAERAEESVYVEGMKPRS